MKPSTLFCFFLVYIIICGINICLAQKYSPKYLRENDKMLLALTSQSTANGWLEFKQDKDTEAINPEEFFPRFSKSLGPGEGYYLKPTQDETDFREIRHQRFQLYYKNIRVEGVGYSLHSRNKRLQTAHGRMIEDLSLDVSKPMPEQKALEIALADQKLTLDDLKGKDLPKGELLIVRLGEEVISQNYKLCYAFDMLVEGVTKRNETHNEPQRIYVDATTGEVVQRASLTSRCFSPAHSMRPALLPLRPTEKKNSFSAVANPLTASTFTPFGINNNRYFGA